MQLPWLYPAKFGLGTAQCTVKGKSLGVELTLDKLRPYGTLISDQQFQPPRKAENAKRIPLLQAVDTLVGFYQL